MPVTPPPPRYHAYVLRCWEEHGRTVPVWRFSLEDPHTGTRRGFVSLPALVAFVERTLVGGSPPADAPGEVSDARRP